METMQAAYLVVQILGGIITVITAFAVVTGKVFFVKTHTRVLLDKQEERIGRLESDGAENKHMHALLLKCSMAVIDGMKRGKINGEIDDVEEEIKKKIFDEFSGKKH